MPIDQAQKAIDIGNLYQGIAQEMGDYLQTNIAAMVNDPVTPDEATDAINKNIQSIGTID